MLDELAAEFRQLRARGDASVRGINLSSWVMRHYAEREREHLSRRGLRGRVVRLVPEVGK